MMVNKNRKPNTKLEKTRKPGKTPKLKDCSFTVRKPKNRTKNWPDPQNRKYQRPSLPVTWYFITISYFIKEWE